jgi:type III secretion system YscQ/HrcQ family protein
MTPFPLSQSSLLPRVSEGALALAAVYGMGEMTCPLDSREWRFRWVPMQEPLRGTELVLRVGSAQVAVGVEDLAIFGGAAEINRPEVPADLRAAYLNFIGGRAWQELERRLRRSVEVVAVRTDATWEVSGDCLGFEIESISCGVSTRGLLGPVPPQLQSGLLQACRQYMSRDAARSATPLRWTAVAGYTSLSGQELRALELHDIVVIDDACYTSASIECSLAIGPTRRCVGRARLERGYLRLLEIQLKGSRIMSDIEDAAGTAVSGLGEIPVTLRFEVAQWQSTLAEMESLAPGCVIDLGKPVDQAAVSIWIEQRQIGKGRLVVIGERLGVRLLSIGCACEESSGTVAQAIGSQSAPATLTGEGL